MNTLHHKSCNLYTGPLANINQFVLFNLPVVPRGPIGPTSAKSFSLSFEPTSLSGTVQFISIHTTSNFLDLTSASQYRIMVKEKSRDHKTKIVEKLTCFECRNATDPCRLVLDRCKFGGSLSWAHLATKSN